MLSQRGPTMSEPRVLVLDCGSTTLRLGFAGDALPTVIIPASSGVINEIIYKPTFLVFTQPLSTSIARHGFMYKKIVSPLDENYDIDYDVLRSLLTEALASLFHSRNRALWKELPIIVTGEIVTRQHRLALGRMLLQQLEFPAIYLADQSVLSATAYGVGTGLVVQVGEHATTVLPVYEHEPIRYAMRRMDVGGADLDRRLHAILDGLHRHRTDRQLPLAHHTRYIKHIKHKLCRVRTQTPETSKEDESTAKNTENHSENATMEAPTTNTEEEAEATDSENADIEMLATVTKQQESEEQAKQCGRKTGKRSLVRAEAVEDSDNKQEKTEMPDEDSQIRPDNTREQEDNSETTRSEQQENVLVDRNRQDEVDVEEQQEGDSDNPKQEEEVSTAFQLPEDRILFDLRDEILDCSDILFDAEEYIRQYPRRRSSCGTTRTSSQNSVQGHKQKPEAHGLPQMIVDAIQTCSKDIEEELRMNIMLSGASTLMPGLPEKLESQTRQLLGREVRVLAKESRENCAWTGASIYASSPGFLHQCVTLTEFEDHGLRSIMTKQNTVCYEPRESTE